MDGIFSSNLKNLHTGDRRSRVFERSDQSTVGVHIHLTDPRALMVTQKQSLRNEICTDVVTEEAWAPQTLVTFMNVSCVCKMIEQTLGASLRRLREEQRVSLRALAERADISPSFLSQIENGQCSPSISAL